MTAKEQMSMTKRGAVSNAAWIGAAVMLAMSIACGGNKPPVARPVPPPPPLPDTAANSTSGGVRPPEPPEPVPAPALVEVPPEPARTDSIAASSLDEINRNSPLKPVFFKLDSSELSREALALLDENANLLKRNTTWAVTIEGHCDEQGSAEYNLALGERRAVAARTYLISIGVAADRLRTISYGKEFPFDPGHDEAAHAKNRRAHFVITAK
jgi:peptidoglycan-associated lipoprotein